MRLAYDSTAQRHTLPLTAGQLLGLAVKQNLNAQHPGRLVYAPVNILLGGLTQFEAKGHVVVDRHVGIQRVGLEDHGDVPILRRHIVDQPVADVDIALVDLLQASQETQGCGLAAARRTDEDQELLVGDLNVEVVDRDDITESLIHVFIRYT